MQCGLNIQDSLRSCCSTLNGSYVITATFTIACPKIATGFAFNTGDSQPKGLNFKSIFNRLDCGGRPFRKGAVSVITQLGAFSLQFRSRSGCVFVARWRSGLTIGESRHPTRTHETGLCLRTSLAKETQQLYLTATRRREAFVRFPCLCL